MEQVEVQVIGLQLSSGIREILEGIVCPERRREFCGDEDFFALLAAAFPA